MQIAVAHASFLLSVSSMEHTGVAMRGLLNLYGWKTKNRIPSFIMLLSDTGYMKNMATKQRKKRITGLINFSSIEFYLHSAQ